MDKMVSAVDCASKCPVRSQLDRETTDLRAKLAAAEKRATDFEQELERHSTDRVKMREALEAILSYREHRQGCEIDPTDFCTCGMRNAADKARAALKEAKA